MDVEIPRGPESVNSRQVLSSILGLQRPSKANGTILEALVFKVCNRHGIVLNGPLKRDYKGHDTESSKSEIHRFEEEATLESPIQGHSYKIIGCELKSKFSEHINESQEESAPSNGSSFDKIGEENSVSGADENLKVIETDIILNDFSDDNSVATCENLNRHLEEEIFADRDYEKNPDTDQLLIDGEIKVDTITVPPSKIIITHKHHLPTFRTRLPLPKFEKSAKQVQPKPEQRKIKDESAELQEIISAIEKQPSEIMLQKTKVDAASSRPLTLPSAMELKSVLVGSPENQFIKEWKESELQIPHERFLNFEYGGISGVLAVFQGFLLKAQKFCNIQDKETAFTCAIADILWQSGQRSKACLAICGEEERLAGCGRYRRDGVTETMVLLQFNSIEDTRAGIERHVEQLRAPGGLLLLVVSLVLSKGLEEFRGRPPLLNKANLTLVNLTLTGRLDMKEAKQRAEIGLLSLAEHYKHLKIPSCLKTPRWPIWVAELGPDNYAVVSSTNPKLVADWRAELAFRLHILDSEGLRSAAITTGGELSEDEERSATYLEMIIRTKWSGAQIRWL